MIRNEAGAAAIGKEGGQESKPARLYSSLSGSIMTIRFRWTVCGSRKLSTSPSHTIYVAGWWPTEDSANSEIAFEQPCSKSNDVPGTRHKVKNRPAVHRHFFDAYQFPGSREPETCF